MSKACIITHIDPLRVVYLVWMGAASAFRLLCRWRCSS
jgi:hypothetical protein